MTDCIPQHQLDSRICLQSLAFPMLSTSIFASNGTRYNQKAVFGPTFTLNHTALNEIGLPALTGTYDGRLSVILTD